MEETWTHQTVLLEEAVDALAIRADGHYVDATFGRGGHSRRILSRLSPAGRLTVFDKDPQAIEAAQQLARSDARVTVRHEGFRHLGELGGGSADGILMDLGVSSPQIDDPARGFLFATTVLWTCAWTPRAARAWPNGLKPSMFPL